MIRLRAQVDEEKARRIEAERRLSALAQGHAALGPCGDERWADGDASESCPRSSGASVSARQSNEGLASHPRQHPAAQGPCSPVEQWECRHVPTPIKKKTAARAANAAELAGPRLAPSSPTESKAEQEECRHVLTPIRRTNAAAPNTRISERNMDAAGAKENVPPAATPLLLGSPRSERIQLLEGQLRAARESEASLRLANTKLQQQLSISQRFAIKRIGHIASAFSL